MINVTCMRPAWLPCISPHGGPPARTCCLDPPPLFEKILMTDAHLQGGTESGLLPGFSASQRRHCQQTLYSSRKHSMASGIDCSLILLAYLRLSRLNAELYMPVVVKQLFTPSKTRKPIIEYTSDMQKRASASSIPRSGIRTR